MFCAYRASLKANREDHQQPPTKSKKKEEETHRDKRRRLLCLATPAAINLGQGHSSLHLWIYLAHYFHFLTSWSDIERRRIALFICFPFLLSYIWIYSPLTSFLDTWPTGLYCSHFLLNGSVTYVRAELPASYWTRVSAFSLQFSQNERHIL